MDHFPCIIFVIIAFAYLPFINPIFSPFLFSTHIPFFFFLSPISLFFPFSQEIPNGSLPPIPRHLKMHHPRPLRPDGGRRFRRNPPSFPQCFPLLHARRRRSRKHFPRTPPSGFFPLSLLNLLVIV